MSIDNTTSVSDIKLRQARLVEQNKARLRDAVRTSEESSQIGRESLVTMHDQGKQLERINHSLDDVDVNLNRAERVLRSLTFWGRVRNFFTLDRTGRAWKYEPVEGKSTAVAETVETDAPPPRPPRTRLLLQQMKKRQCWRKCWPIASVI
jgi:hypothetical protein